MSDASFDFVGAKLRDVTRALEAASLILGSVVVFIVWAVMTTNDTSHPIDFGLAAGPLVCLVMSGIALAIACIGLRTKVTAGLVVAVVLATCELPVFAYMSVAVALGIPAAN